MTDRPRAQLVRTFLDGSQYSAASILRYERMFGKGFVSTGGLATTQAREPFWSMPLVPLTACQDS